MGCHREQGVPEYTGRGYSAFLPLFYWWRYRFFRVLCLYHRRFLVVCVCSHPIYSGRQVGGRTSRGHTGGRSHRRRVTQEEGHTGFLHNSFCDACPNFFSREGFSLSFPSSTVKSIFCVVYPRNNRSPLVGHFFFRFCCCCCCEEKSLFV